MAIRIKFDSDYNVEAPTLILAERNGKRLGLISNIFEINLTDRLNSAAEISFKVYKELDGVKSEIWDNIDNFKLIWCREWDKWFEINVEINESNGTVKNVSGVSLCEAELSQINLYDIEINTETDISRKDYVLPTVFYNAEDKSISLLHRLMEKVPHYRIEYVSPTLVNIQRTFSFDDISLYDAFGEISEEIECIFIFNSGTDKDGLISRSISVYDLKDYCNDCGYRGVINEACPECGEENIIYGYGENTLVYVDSGCLGDEITLASDTESVKNCFKLKAGDELMTAAVISLNPNGSSYLWRISEEMRQSMSKNLRDRLAEYDKTYNSFEPFSISNIREYNALVKDYNSKDSKAKLVEIPDVINSYSQLTESYFNSIDFKLFLEDEFMPTPSMDNPTSLSEQIKLIQNLRGTTIGTTSNLSYTSLATAESYVLSYLKTVITQAYYKIKVVKNSGSFNNNTYIGNFKITELANEENSQLTGNISFVITNDFETYIKQRIDKTVKNVSDNEDVDVVALFKLGLNEFAAEMEKYCLNSLVSYQKMCQSILDVLMEMGLGNSDADAYDITNSLTSEEAYAIYSDYYDKKSAVEREISDRENEIKIIEGIQAEIEKKRDSIQDLLNIEKFLGKDLWKELSSYRREETYSNNNFISDGLTNKELFERAAEFIKLANEEIIKASTVQHSISAEVKNLLVIEDFKPLTEKFSVGNYIRLRVADELYRLRLIEYTVDFDSLQNIFVEFSDALKVANGLSDVESVLKQMNSMASSYDYVEHQAAKTEKNSEMLSGWVNKGLDATNVMLMNSSENQSVIYDEHGILCRQYDDITEDYSPKQLKIINKGLYFTDDNWEHVKTGVGNFIYYDPEDGVYKDGYGVIADTIVANIILSEKVGIYNRNNSIKLGSEGLVITANGDDTSVNNLITLQKAKTVNGKTEYEKMLYMDENGNLIIDGSSVNITSSALGGLYETVSQLSIASNSIEAAVSSITGGTYKQTSVKLDSEKVRIAWNGNSDYVQFENGGLNIYSPQNSKLVSLDGTGLVVNNGAITVKDINGKNIFYTDSNGKTNFSGTILMEITDESGSNTGFASKIDETGMFCAREYYGSYIPSIGFATDSLRQNQPVLAFYYLEKNLGDLNIPIGKIYSTYISKPEGEGDYLGYGYELIIQSEISATYFLDNQSQGAVRIIGKQAELRVGYGEINYQGSLNNYSDVRLKENISEINSELACKIINSLNPISYNFKTNKEKIHYGMSAQDVLGVLEENNIDTSKCSLVGTNSEYLSLSYIEFIPLLIQTVKQQQKEIENLKSYVNKL